MSLHIPQQSPTKVSGWMLGTLVQCGLVVDFSITYHNNNNMRAMCGLYVFEIRQINDEVFHET